MLVVPDLAPSFPATATRRRFERAAVAAFLTSQADVLRRGLDAAGDADVVASVLASHEQAHERWVDTIAAVDGDCGADAAQRLSTLYGFHGRVAGSLEAGATRMLAAEVAETVRGLVTQRLDQLTGEATTALNT